MKSLFAGRAPRRWAVSVAAVAVVGALGAVPVGSGVAHADPYECGGGAVILVAGTNDPGAGALVGVQQRYTGLGPDGKPDGNSPYNAEPYKVIVAEYPTTLWPLGSVGYNDDVERGKAATEAAIAEYREHCGVDNEIVVAGYSQGARVAGDVLSDIANGRTDLPKENLRGELYSDPRRDGPESARGIELGMIGVLPGLTMMGPRKDGFGDIPVTSYCIQGDAVCDLPDPLHDPFGAIDGLVGYFTKHGLYPFQMYKPVDAWDCDEVQTGAYIDCMVKMPSAISGLRQDLVDKVRETLGLAPRQVADLWGLLPNINGIFPHANLSDLQKYIAPVMTLLPQLPKLGYGGYLPDLLMLTDVLEGVVKFDVDKISAGLKGLAGSALSIIAMPVNFADYWVRQALAVARPSTTGLVLDDTSAQSLGQRLSLLPSLDSDASDQDPEAKTSDVRQERLRSLKSDPKESRPDVKITETKRPQTPTEEAVLESPGTKSPGTKSPGTKSSATESSTVESTPTTSTRPTSTPPETGRPETKQPESGQPESGQPESGQPESGQPETKQPELTQRQIPTDTDGLSQLPAAS